MTSRKGSREPRTAGRFAGGSGTEPAAQGTTVLIGNFSAQAWECHKWHQEEKSSFPLPALCVRERLCAGAWAAPLPARRGGLLQPAERSGHCAAVCVQSQSLFSSFCRDQRGQTFKY